jgi:Cu-processing system ATP-binding protein
LTGSVIEARQVSKRFGEVLAVDRVDLEVRRGELFGVIGHNGAGKSTLFRMMLGLLKPSSGEILVNGVPVHGPAFRDVRRSVGYLPENVVFYDNLSGLETLDFFARLKGADRRLSPRLLERVGLADAARRRVKAYSKGMRQRLGLAQALLGQPALLFLDEPTTGLDPLGRREFYDILRGLREEGVTMLLASHVLSEIQERVDRLAIIKSGQLQAVGSVHELREEMGLPLWFDVRLADGAVQGLRESLAHLPVEEIRVSGDRVSVYCRREAKMAVLGVLAGLDGRVRDVHVREPSLEDVFLGYGG